MSVGATRGFVFPNSGRDTMSIIHGCISTLLLTSWSAIHLNVPGGDDSERRVVLRKAKWMLTAIVAPEYVAYLAVREWYDARWLLKELRAVMRSRKLKQIQEKVLDPLSTDPSEQLEHRSTEAGGDEITSEKPGNVTVEHLEDPGRSDSEDLIVSPSITESIHGKQDDRKDNLQDDNQYKEPSWTVEHAHYILMGAVKLVCKDKSTFRPNAIEFLALLNAELVDLPDLSTEDIRALSKSDIFAKGWACMQMFWFSGYLLTRVCTHLPITTLELFVAGQVLCTLVMYLGWWKKPKDICIPTSIYVQVAGLSEIHKAVAKARGADKDTDLLRNEPGARVANNHSIDRRITGMKYFTLVSYVPTLLFGTCHMLGWEQYFVTEVEKVLWRISSVICLVLPLVVVGLGDCARRRDIDQLDPGFSALLLLYVVFRVYMCGEMFAGLRQTPAGVYLDSQWCRFVPHVGS